MKWPANERWRQLRMELVTKSSSHSCQRQMIFFWTYSAKCPKKITTWHLTEHMQIEECVWATSSDLIIIFVSPATALLISDMYSNQSNIYSTSENIDEDLVTQIAFQQSAWPTRCWNHWNIYYYNRRFLSNVHGPQGAEGTGIFIIIIEDSSAMCMARKVLRALEY